MKQNVTVAFAAQSVSAEQRHQLETMFVPYAHSVPKSCLLCCRDLGSLASLAESAMMAKDYFSAYIMFKVLTERKPDDASVCS